MQEMTCDGNSVNNEFPAPMQLDLISMALTPKPAHVQVGKHSHNQSSHKTNNITKENYHKQTSK